MKAVGAFSVKSYNQPRRDQRQQIIEAARELGMMVVPEGGSLFQHNMTMIVDGHTTIEHSVPVAEMYDDVKQLWRQTGTGYTPTLVVAYGGIWGENYWYAADATSGRTSGWRTLCRAGRWTRARAAGSCRRTRSGTTSTSRARRPS